MHRTHCTLVSLALVCILGSASDAQVRERSVRTAVTPTAGTTLDRGATMTLLRPMPAPTNLAATGTPATASLRWDVAPGAIGYYVSRRDEKGNTVKLTANAITATSFEDLSGGVKPGIAYTYNVTAVHPNDGVGTAQVSFIPPPAEVPAWVRVEPRGSDRTLEWASVAGAASYHILETWQQPIYKTVYTTVYSADGQPRQVASTQVTGYQYLTRTYHVTATQLPIGAAASGHRFDVAAAYPPSGVTAPRGQWRSMVVP